MQEERLKNMEGYTEQLIRMVADNNKIFSEMRQDFKDEKQVNQHRHEVLLTKLKQQNADTDYLRDQVSNQGIDINRRKNSELIGSCN
ncbi:hypothetical protein HUG20_02115 [Salicibibacter cibi]|uniref:Uncharacterized protein n=1 Tax=Salicibibacter cibi TaxID=2743001 RepID=A0A7T6Z8K3_9BACI|nr:hypothetical protein [Salicibibacter cibi]QQK78816.1 hypothetical protein HUG20_02115 [Salicibibacter cibi]